MCGDTNCSSGSQMEGCLRDIDDWDLSGAHVSKKCYNLVVEPGWALSGELQLAHEPVKDVNHEGVAPGDQAEEGHRLPVTK